MLWWRSRADTGRTAQEKSHELCRLLAALHVWLLPHLLLTSRTQCELEDDSGYLSSPVLCMPVQGPKHSGIALRMGLANRCRGHRKISCVVYEKSHTASGASSGSVCHQHAEE